MTSSLAQGTNDDPFIDNGLLCIPDLAGEPEFRWHPFQKASNFFELDNEPAWRKQDALPELRSDFFALDSQKESFPELEPSLESTSASENGEAVLSEKPAQEDEAGNDVWSWNEVIIGAVENKLATWESFLKPQAEEPRSAYLSEAGPVCFDAFITKDVSNKTIQTPKFLAKQDEFLRSIFELAIGRDSLFYRYDQTTSNFIQTTQELGLLGVSSEALEKAVKDAMDMGKGTRKLESFITEPKTTPLMIALSSALSDVLYAMKTQLDAWKRGVQSMLQFEQIIYRPHSLVRSLVQLIETSTSINHSPRDAIVQLMLESDNLAACNPWQSRLLRKLLGRFLAPLMSAIEAEVGLLSAHSTIEIRDLLSLDSKEDGLETSGAQDRILTAVEELVQESRSNLDILQYQQASHPALTSMRNSSSDLSFETSWEGILRIQKQAQEYENSLKKAILEYSQGSTLEVRDAKQPETADATPLGEDELILIDLDAPTALDKTLGGSHRILDSSLSEATIAALRFPSPVHQVDLEPPLSQCVELSCVPLLAAQSRLLSFSTLHLLFTTHSLRTHLSLQHRFQLLSDGLFASRLSRALFDPDQSTGEGRRKAEGTTGLRLQARDTWPPASSELRLVLMGILNESYQGGTNATDSVNDDLPGNLSFAIRDLSPEELEKCRDADSLEALDFLRLQYKPPAVLDRVITQSSLKKYDRIFKQMLRLLRMQAVAQSLLRDVAGAHSKIDQRTQRFRKDIQHFISTLAAYSSDDAVCVEWSRFKKLLEATEDAITRSDYGGTIAKAGSLSRLARIHEEVLDRIIRALFLDRRQAQVREVMNDIFGLILRLAGMVRMGSSDDDTEDMRNMHMEFKKQVGRVVRYLRSQGNASTEARHDTEAEGFIGEPPFEHLLVKLDMYGYYA
jgi:hypothetical protein